MTNGRDSLPGMDWVAKNGAAPTVTALTAQSVTMFPALTFNAACSRKGCKFEMRAERRSKLSKAGILLSISSRNSARSAFGWPSGVLSMVARRSRSRRARALRWSNKDAPANTAAETTTNTTMAMSTVIAFQCFELALNLHPRLKQSRPQAVTCSQQPVGKLRPDAGGAEQSFYFATFLNTLSLEHEDVLHGNHFSIHASHL